MKKKWTIILAFFALLTVGAALWQGHEAVSLEENLLAIDRQTQANRLLELTLPRVQAEMGRLLAEERGKLGNAPPIGHFGYPMPGGGKADFNKGFFLLSPAGLQIPDGEDAFGSWLERKPAILDTLRRKADNPSAPVYDPSKPHGYDRKTQLPVFAIYEVKDTDFDHPVKLSGAPGPFFAWSYKGDLIYMRSVPTTHGNAAEGFVIDADKLAERLLPLAEPGLGKPEIGFCQRGETANLAPLPLILRPGPEISLPDTAARQKALSGTVASAWLISILSILILFALLAFYARLERRRSDFVAAVTHELRTPLTSFNLYTEMLCKGNLPPEKAKEYHETLYHESRRLGHLVENVLAFARLTRGKVRGRQDAGPCNTLLTGLFSKISDRLRQAGVEFRYTIDARVGLLSLRTDLLSVEQILTNLADNAIKYAENPAPAVTANAIQTHRTLALRFSDNGPGISPEARRKLFRPFSRSARATGGQKPGVGLGLALSRDLARSIGGDLMLERSDGTGATFLLTLPLGE